MITRETDYAVRAMMYLAIQPDFETPVSSSELAEKMDIPYRFLRKIVLKLIKDGLVNSRRGKNGGLNIAKPPQEVSLLQIMNAVDPAGITLNICLPDNSKCPRSSFCGLHTALSDIQRVFDDKLSDVKLSDLCVPDKKRLFPSD